MLVGRIGAGEHERRGKFCRSPPQVLPTAPQPSGAGHGACSTAALPWRNRHESTHCHVRELDVCGGVRPNGRSNAERRDSCVRPLGTGRRPIRERRRRDARLTRPARPRLAARCSKAHRSGYGCVRAHEHHATSASQGSRRTRGARGSGRDARTFAVVSTSPSSKLRACPALSLPHLPS